MKVHQALVEGSHARTSSRAVSLRSAFALRTVLLGASFMPIRCIASSSYESCAEASLRSVWACLVCCSCFKFALACSLRGPVNLPPYVAHSRLPSIAGASHLSFVRLLRALQRRHLSLLT